MSTIRLEPARVGPLSARAPATAWGSVDLQLILYALALVIIGLLMAFTNSGDAPLQPGSLFTRGLVWLALAIVAFTVASLIDHRVLIAFGWPIYLVNIGLLVLTLAVGTGIGGLSGWVTIFGLQFQFSEVAKILMAIVLARYLAGRGRSITSLSTIVGALALTLPPLVLVLLQPDLGTSLVFGAIVAGSLFLAGASLRWMGAWLLSMVAALPIIWGVLLRDYQKQRLLSFLDPTSDPLGTGYQLIQSQIAVGSGGFFGKGLTNGSTGQQYLPVEATDFVFARLGEELGFVGGLITLLLYGLLLWRILLVGWRSRSPFALAFAGGIGGMLLFQLVVNVGMVLGVMPITGIPLPFISNGGSSLISVAIGLGILQGLAMRRDRNV